MKRDADRRTDSRGSFKRIPEEYIICWAPVQEYCNMEKGDWVLLSSGKSDLTQDTPYET